MSKGRRKTLFNYLGFPCYWEVVTVVNTATGVERYGIRRDYARGLKSDCPKPTSDQERRIVVTKMVKKSQCWNAVRRKAFQEFVRRFGMTERSAYAKGIESVLSEMMAKDFAEDMCRIMNRVDVKLCGAWKPSARQ